MLVLLLVLERKWNTTPQEVPSWLSTRLKKTRNVMSSEIKWKQLLQDISLGSTYYFPFPLLLLPPHKNYCFLTTKKQILSPALHFTSYKIAVLGPLQKREVHFFTSQCSTLSASQALYFSLLLFRDNLTRLHKLNKKLENQN